MRVSPGALIGVIALVFAVTGAAVALPGKGSVDSGDIQKNAVKSKHIKNKQVKASDVNVASVGGLFGAGLLGGEGDIPPAAANIPGVAGLPVIGSGGGFASLPIPRGGLTLRDLIVTSDAVETRPIIVGFERNDDNVFLNCAINIGQTSCQSDAGDRLRLEAGDTLNMNAIAPGSPAPFGGAELTYGYRAVGG
jgi:hypothetical protein